MIKKEYLKPAQTMVTLQHSQVLCVSEVTTTGLGSDNLNYTSGSSGNMQNDAWAKKNHSIWDEEW